MTEARKRILRRRKRIGVLLRKSDCTLAEIARQVGVSASCVKIIQKRFFPELRDTRYISFTDVSAPAVTQRHEAIGIFLRETDLSLAEIAKRVGVTRNAVHQIQKKYFPEFPRHKQAKPKPEPQGIRSRKGFRIELISMLRSSGDMWCCRCRQVKCLTDFNPYIQKGANGKPCKKCATEIMRAWYRKNRSNDRRTTERDRARTEGERAEAWGSGDPAQGR